MQSDGSKGLDIAISRPDRRYDVDWLRLMAVFLLFFHTARIFDPWEQFYVQNNSLSHLVFNIFIRPLGPWHMSVFFLLAGASSCQKPHNKATRCCSAGVPAQHPGLSALAGVPSGTRPPGRPSSPSTRSAP